MPNPSLANRIAQWWWKRARRLRATLAASNPRPLVPGRPTREAGVRPLADSLGAGGPR